MFQNELLSLYSVPVSVNSLCGSLGVCVRLLEGNITIGDVAGTLLGTSALLFVLPPPVSEDPEWVRPSQLYQWNNGKVESVHLKKCFYTLMQNSLYGRKRIEDLRSS